MPGLGIACKVNGSQILLGNRRLMEKYKIPLCQSTDKKMNKFEMDGKT